jgi:hypothetical protein
MNIKMFCLIWLYFHNPVNGHILELSTLIGSLNLLGPLLEVVQGLDGSSMQEYSSVCHKVFRVRATNANYAHGVQPQNYLVAGTYVGDRWHRGLHSSDIHHAFRHDQNEAPNAGLG